MWCVNLELGMSGSEVVRMVYWTHQSICTIHWRIFISRTLYKWTQLYINHFQCKQDNKALGLVNNTNQFFSFLFQILFSLFTCYLGLVFSIPKQQKHQKECESEISQKGALVSRLEAKTQEISRMLIKLNNHQKLEEGKNGWKLCL